MFLYAHGQSPASSSRRSASWHEKVVLVCKVKARDGKVEGEAEAEVDACAESGWYDACVWACAASRNAKREAGGMLAEVTELGLYRSVGRVLSYRPPRLLLLLDEPVVSWEVCRGEVTVYPE